jgi:hypothetical protein
MKKITLFIGLNDKDTKTQLVNTSEAIEILSGYIVKNLGIGTLSEAAGVYTHDNGETISEKTIRAEFYTDDVNAVKGFAEFAKSALNQESVAFEVSHPEIQFI